MLLFAIVTGLKIDVRSLIQESILKTLRGSTSGGLLHPSLITALCKVANVQVKADEILLPPMGIIDHTTISRYKVCEGATSHARGEGYLLISQPPPSRVGSSTQHSELNSSSAGPLVDILASLTLLHQKVDVVGQRVDRQSRHIDVVAQWQDLMMQYQAEFATIVANIYSSSADEDEDMSFQFPTPPVLPLYPPPSPAMDEGHDGEGTD